MVLTFTNPNAADAINGIAFNRYTPLGPSGHYLIDGSKPTTNTCGGTPVAPGGAFSYSFRGGSLSAVGRCPTTRHAPLSPRRAPAGHPGHATHHSRRNRTT